jgi:hypothetical protein
MPKIISALTVAGEPLWAAPDFVFQEKTSGRIVIVQVKVSDAVIPSDGWPNLRAQLWAYAHVDEWLCAREMLLVGEVWDLTLDGIVFRGTVRWECGDREFHRNNLELFELYGGAHTGLPSGERCL